MADSMPAYPVMITLTDSGILSFVCDKKEIPLISFIRWSDMITAGKICSSFCSASTGDLISVDFTWVGDAGYKAEGNFVYDDAATQIQAQGEELGDFNDGLYYLEISFFDPSNTSLYSAINVLDGIVQYEYLNFNFDTPTMEFFGIFDMGGGGNGFR